jgi:hypothetical protein
MFVIADHDVDLYEYMYESLLFRTQDFQIIPIYYGPNTINICIKRLDISETEKGWTDDLKILIYSRKYESKKILHIGPQTTNPYYIKYETEYLLEPSTQIAYERPSYRLPDVSEPISISRQVFNEIFSTNLIVLPYSLYAVGYKDGAIYIYSEKYTLYWEIYFSFRFMVVVAKMTNPESVSFYFVIAGNDGYMERVYYSNMRTEPYMVGDRECEEVYLFEPPLNTQYSVFHNKKHIIAQCVHKNLPYAIPVVDRNYFFHNLYNSFRSWHRGIPFREKIAKVIYCGNNNDNKYNWFSNREETLSPREYLKSEKVKKENIVVPSQYVSRHDMVNYKYILDIDGISSTWCATAWKMNSGSVIFKHKSVWEQWFHHEYLPGIHYVEISEDFSDIQEKYEWCEAHPEECEKMVNACKDLFQRVYCMENVILNTREILKRIIE